MSYNLKYRDQNCPSFKWYDYRFIKPSPRGYDQYLVIYEKFDGFATIIPAGYLPKYGYTDGDFIYLDIKIKNKASLDKLVRYWAPLPKIPSAIEKLIKIPYDLILKRDDES